MNINVVLIRKAMQDRGLQLKALAAMMGLAPSRLSQMLNRGSTTSERAEQLATFLGLTISQVTIPDGESHRELYDRLAEAERAIKRQDLRQDIIELEIVTLKLCNANKT